ncbi:MAG: sulfite exporter TauE/SafE family protein [Desulfobaccales bacterium]|nr:sulfite exporter TauE/SafE family protein [Desulfobaccales bacterium]
MGKRPGNPLLASKAIILTGGLMLCLVGLTETAWGAAGAAAATAPGGATPWWVWALVLLGFSFLVGILSLLGGMGGGTLFVSIIGGFLPFHLDFVRCASLLVALCGALSAGPGLLRFGMGDLRLSLPAALMTSSGAILGAMIGLRLPTHIVQVALGFTLLGVVVLLLRARRAEYPEVKEPDALSALLGIHGIYLDRATEEEVSWKVHRTPVALLLFLLIGIMAGVFGIGAGWANVTVLNLIMGAPIKVAVGTSKLIICLTNTSAAWIYLHSGAVLLVIVVPSIIGMMLGSWAGVNILVRIAPIRLRYIVIALLLFAGIRSLLKGLGIWN